MEITYEVCKKIEDGVTQTVRYTIDDDEVPEEMGAYEYLVNTYESENMSVPSKGEKARSARIIEKYAYTPDIGA